MVVRERKRSHAFICDRLFVCLIGEVVPVRIFLSACPLLAPTYDDVGKLFSVRYYLNLVLVDQDARRYYKQQEITILRDDIASVMVNKEVTLLKYLPQLLTVQ